MKLYEDVIGDIETLTSQKRLLEVEEAWPEGDKNQFIFGNDCAFECGNDHDSGLSGVLLTDESNIKDQVYLLGPDIKDIKKDNAYARIALIQVDDSKMGEGNALFRSIRNIEYMKFRLTLKDVMVRISSLNQKETLRISKVALKEHLNFSRIGYSFIESYHKQEAVKGVTIIFITNPTFDYRALAKKLEKASNITQALDHLLNKVKMDCNACKLQVVCKEVEEKTKEVFKK